MKGGADFGVIFNHANINSGKCSAGCQLLYTEETNRGDKTEEPRMQRRKSPRVGLDNLESTWRSFASGEDECWRIFRIWRG